jgi:hypothetical protein
MAARKDMIFRKIEVMISLDKIDWNIIKHSLDEQGFSRIPGVLQPDECIELRKLYLEEQIFRSTVNMQRYRFGKGEYKYFNYPLPAIIQTLRSEFYKPLLSIANDWMGRLGTDIKYPADHQDFIAHCRARKQIRPTPLILRYEGGGYNTLHQDLYGEIFFPFQLVVILSQRELEYKGGDLVFVEQLPRAQSKAEVVCAEQGEAVIFTTNFRPVKGTRGFYRSKMKHGISPLKSGIRYAVGIIFHDAS